LKSKLRQQKAVVNFILWSYCKSVYVLQVQINLTLPFHWCNFVKEINTIVEKKDLTAEEKLEKIIDLMNKDKADSININILKNIIGIDPAYHKKRSKPFMPGIEYKVYHKNNEYKENFIS
jgi:GTP1/Obg family GTP-binding protein